MSETTNLKLFKHNEPLETNENQFDVDLALNQNWDKIDDAYGNLNKNIENLQTNDSKQDSLISKLRNAALNAETEEAKSLHITDANKFGSLEVLGNHEQETREGYNILDYLDYIVTSKNNLTIKKDEKTGYITVDGTPNADYTVILSETINITDLLEDKQTYTIFQENHSDNLDEKIYLQVTISDKDGSNPQYLNSSNKNRSFEVDKSLKQYHVKVQTGTIRQAGTFTNYKNRFMIYKGTEEKEFELYGASPSTDYPSPVACLGSNKNELDIEEIETNSYASVVDNQNGILELEGINGYYSGVYIKKQLKPNTDYTICAKLTEVSDNGRGMIEVNSNSNFLEHSFANLDFNKELVKKSISFKTDVTGLVYMIFYCNWVGNNEHVKYENIKLEEGTEATSYSLPGQGSTKISKINKNFLDLTKLKTANNNGIDAYSIDNLNQITLKNKVTTSGEAYGYAFQAFHLNLPQGNYNLSAKVDTNSNNYRIIIRGKKDGSNTIATEVVSQSKNNGNFNIDYSQCDEYTIEFYANQAYVEQLVTTTYYDIQIQKGNTATDYVEHEQTDYILDIQQEMLKGDYFVKEDDGWKEVHNWNKVILDETKNYSLASNNRYIFVTTLAAVNEMYQINCICDKLTSTSLSTMVSSTEVNLVAVNESNINIKPNNEITTVEQFKDWIQENNITVYYKLATPTKITCTPEQTAVLEELSNLELFDGVNNIITAEDIALLKLKYALDVKTYVNNQLANINQQILEIAGGN